MKKIFAITLAVTMMAWTVGPVGALTIQEQIDALMAQIQSLQAQLGQGAGYSFTRDLTVGSRGDDVTALQNYLKGTGHFTYATATGYFGPITKAAVAAWQAANGVSPAVGYFGSISRAKYTALVGAVAPTPTPVVTATPTPGVPTPEPGVEPSEGSVELKLNPSPASLTEVRLGEAAKAVMAFDVKAKSSNITIKRIDVQFTHATDTIRPWIYFTHVGLYDGDNAIVGITPTSANSFEYTTTKFGIRFDNLNIAVVKNATKVITVKVAMPTTIIGVGADKSIIVTVPDTNGIRFVDTTGLSSTYGSGVTTRTYVAKVVAEGTVEMSLNANTPAERVVQTSESSMTESIEALRVDLKAKTTNSTLKTFKVGLTDTATGANLVSGLRLYDGDTLISSVAAAGTAHYTFTDLEVALTKDVNKTLMVKIDTIASATSGIAVVLATTTAVTAEDVNYTSISENTGTATGKTVHLYNKAPQLALVSGTLGIVPDTANKLASGNIRINVTAVGGDIFIKKFTNMTNSGIYASSTAANASTTFTVAAVSGATLGAWGWQIPGGATAVFDAAVGVNNTDGSEGAFHTAWLSKLTWATVSDGSGGDSWTDKLGLGAHNDVSDATLKTNAVGPMSK